MIGVFQPADCPVVLPEGIELPEGFEFGYVMVPEVHAQPAGPTIEIAVARVRSFSANPAPDPLVLNTGGPGDSNLDQFLPVVAGDAGKAILAQRDVVIIGSGPAGLTAAIVHVFNHALAKGALFLAVAALAMRFSTLTVGGLRGAARSMPGTATEA